MIIGDERCNVLMWMDHRAVAEAQLINNTRHPLLRSVGGSVSLEMQLPKLLWLKKVSRRLINLFIYWKMFLFC